VKNTSPCGQHILKTEQHPNPPTPELGKVGAEHVLNLLARLKGDAPVMPIFRWLMTDTRAAS
jgi:hypothetical protein